MTTDQNTTEASAAMTAQIPSTLAVRFGSSKRVVSVRDYAHASEIWCKLRDEQCFGGSDSPKVTIVNIETGKTVATISYNGRVWDMKGKEIALPGYKTAAQCKAEDWK